MKFRVLKRGGYSVGSISLTGGETTEPVTLSRNPQGANEAATKHYIDSKSDNISVTIFASGVMPVGRLPAFTGDIVKVEGNGETTIKSTGVSSGDYPKVTVNSKGQVTSGTSLLEGDIPSLPWGKLTSDIPTTLGGYGINNALSLNGGTMTGPLKIGSIGESLKNLVHKAYIDQLVANGGNGVDIGDVVYKLTNITPEGFLKANGGAISKTTYADLYSVIGDKFASSSDKRPIGSGRPWQQQYEINLDQTSNITGWENVGNLPITLANSQAIVTKNRVYLLGGRNSSHLSNTYFAPINEDGTLGSWTQGANLPVVISDSNLVVTKNRAYLLGGYNGNIDAISTVLTAPINQDGTLGTWVIGTNLPVGIGGSQVIMTRNRVYLLGGHFGRSFTDIVLTAPINEDGTLGTWVSGTSLRENLAISQAVVTKNKVYLLGGNSSIGFSNSIHKATINADGTISNWTLHSIVVGLNIPTKLAASQVLVTKNRVYLLGGQTDTGRTANIYSATIDSEGVLGTWATSGAISTVTSRAQVIVTKNRVYLLGGYDSVYLSTIQTATIQGGVNDYSPYYDGTIMSVDPEATTFKLPNITSKLTGATAYLKY